MIRRKPVVTAAAVGMLWACPGAFLPESRGQECSPRWSEAFSHVVFGEGDVRAMLRAEVGGASHVIFTGHFLIGGTMFANGIVRHTDTPGGRTWNAFGSGLTSSAPPGPHAVGGYTLAVYDDGTGPELYVGGVFDAADGVGASNIARWNGTAWSPLGTPGAEGTDDVIRTLAVYDDGSGPALYIGGLFSTAGGQAASRIARYRGGVWSTIGALEGGTGAYAMTVFDDGQGESLFVGGDFTSAGGSAAYLIARYQGSGWSAVGAPLAPPLIVPEANILALTAFDLGTGPALYAGGRETPCAFVLEWDGFEWSRLDGCLGGQFVSSLLGQLEGGVPTLFAGGYFAQGVSRYRAGIWTSATTSFGIRSLMLDDSDPTEPTLLAGGRQVIRRVGGAWNWYRPARGIISGHASAIATRVDSGGEAEVFVGGTPMNIAGVPIASVGRWHEGEWNSVGAQGSLAGNVYALEFFDAGGGEQLYAGGLIDSSPGLYFARLRNGSWEYPLTLPVSNPVHALHAATINGQRRLYVGGEFTWLGQTAVNGIFEFDGSVGMPLGTGLGFPPGGGVRVIAAFDDGSGAQLYVGGGFESAGGVPARSIARWDGVQWRALGTGIDGETSALASMNTPAGPRLFAGGSFSSAGTAASINIAAWDGAQWHALPPQFSTNRPVTTLNVLREGSRERLLVGARGPQIWDGETWTSFTDAANPAPRAVGTIERPGNASDVYILGTFTWYGDRSASGIALQHRCPSCYPNCDNSTTAPTLNVDDFTCFTNRFAAAMTLPYEQQVGAYANCDGSTVEPVLNIDDFTCFIHAFAAGCP